MKSSVYRHTVVTACALGLLGLLLGCWEMSVSFESTNSNTSSRVSQDTSQLDVTSASPVPDETVTSTSTSSPATTPTNQVGISSTHILAERQNSVADAKNQGTLRISNQTDQPVRLALLPRQPLEKDSSNKPTNYDIPAHWDFDPQEGSEKGLLLSLPHGNLKLEKGDIIVAFAQDGSRRYWGPYVVGETSLPKWNTQNREWLLVLTP